ncbi:hypothetical protein CKO36_07525 [Rhabdochromatium marinum]|nr:hypothetical protein [Rhabdochromatium marinum]
MLAATALSLGFAAPLLAAKPPPPQPDRIQLRCVEQPSRQVSFGASGQVSYTEVPASDPEPITLTVVKLGSGPDTQPEPDYSIEPAHIDSSTDWLKDTQAVWTRGGQISAANGLLHIDLIKHQLFFTQAMANGNATFRRFDCEQLPSAAPASNPASGPTNETSKP